MESSVARYDLELCIARNLAWHAMVLELCFAWNLAWHAMRGELCIAKEVAWHATESVGR